MLAMPHSVSSPSLFFRSAQDHCSKLVSISVDLSSPPLPRLDIGSSFSPSRSLSLIFVSNLSLFLATAPFLSLPITKTSWFQHCCASSSPPEQPVVASQQKRKKSVESTDWVASSLTRRFGIGAGLAWVGFLAFGVVSEQIKTRIEVSQEEGNTRDVEEEKEMVLPNGIRYYDLRLGGGATPRPGDLVVIDLKGQVQGTGQVFVDTFGNRDKKKPLALVVGSKPYSKGLLLYTRYIKAFL